MESLINALDTIIKNKSKPEIKGVQEQLLEPNNMLFLLLLTDVLMHINRFSKYLQNKNLIFATIGHKFVQLREAVLAMKDIEGPSFKENAIQFLRMSHQRMELPCHLQDNNLLGQEETIEEQHISIWKSRNLF